MLSEIQLEKGWNGGRTHFGSAGAGILRVTLLFGSAAVALALILTPIAENRTRTVVASHSPFGIDRIATGSTSAGTRTYTVRRSVLQPSPGAVCIIRGNGSRTGSC